MDETLTFQFDVGKDEMQRLYEENGFEAQLERLVANEIPDPKAGTFELELHESFCCKKRTVRYCDGDDEMALICHVTPAPAYPRAPYNIIQRLRIGKTVYVAAAPRV
jgi:hypothetical protein